MHLIDHISVDLIIPDMEARTKAGALRELAARLGADLAEGAIHRIYSVLLDRENLASTGIGNGIGIPHGKLDALGTLRLGVGRSVAGLDFDSVDGKPTQLFFALVAPEGSTSLHLKALARISRLCKEPGFRARLMEAETAGEMLDILRREESKLWTE